MCVSGSSGAYKPLLDTVRVDLLVDFFDKSLKHRTRSAFGKVIGTVRNHVLHGLSPPHGSCQLRHQIGLDFFRLRVRFRVHILIYRTFRRMEFRCLDSRFQFH